jgi:hypothetical protein
MNRRDRGEKKERPATGKKAEMQAQQQMVTNIMEEVRTIDSEISLLKQKMNLIIREINVLKRVVLVEKKEIKELKVEEERGKSRFESMLNIVRGIKGDSDSEETV